ncbi:site-specific recombinase XerD [Murinocardiopsis flavida]|uniref:Site-specific recombinase XerD n=1 Tax=Murinocardiopsis flavida TaxID=645275 RepID=A0A2P8DGA2_9ACTN|nr:site-specific integrase [Murinocardiopsis flavida]PSK96242.1 site-specific recombinase XerD [Murinocardiopsis flavida]
MAQIESRTLSDGSARYRVKWRLGGARTGGWQFETFDNHPAAVSFKLAVEHAGHQWPDGWVEGFGWHPDYRPGFGWTAREDETEDAEPVRFREYALDIIASMSGIDDRTRADYTRDLRRHLLPYFGGMDVRDPRALSAKAVREWVNRLRDGIPDPTIPINPTTGAGSKKGAKRGHKHGWLREPLRPKTIQNLHGLLFIILESAVKTEPPLRQSNPAARTKLPRVDDGEGDEEMCFLTREEFALLRASIQEDVRDMLEVFFLTGMRYSELTAVQVRDVTTRRQRDPSTGRTVLTGYVEVRRAWKRRPDNTFELGAPKTKKSRRRIALSPRATALVTARTTGKKPTDFLFTTKNGCWWRHASFYTRRWSPAVKKAQAEGLHKKPRIHDLRHSHVALLIEENLHPFKIQRRLGHQSITTTMDRYGHLISDIDDEILAAIDGEPDLALYEPSAALTDSAEVASMGGSHLKLVEP